MQQPGKQWNYSSGTTNILSRILRDAIDDDRRYWSFLTGLVCPLE